MNENIPCESCLVFPCCKNRALYKDTLNGWGILLINRLGQCKIFSDWFNNINESPTDKKQILRDHFKVKYVWW